MLNNFFMLFHISRWRYALGYLIVIVLVFIAMWRYDKGADVLGIVLAILSAVLLVFLEVLIRRKRLHIDDEVKFVDGKNTTVIPRDSEVTVSQSAIGMLLGFGDVKIKTGESELVLNMFNLPTKIERMMKR